MSIISEMQQGNLDALRSGNASDSPAVVAAAIVSGIEHNVDDPIFLSELQKQCSNNTTILNTRIGDLASFALSKSTEKQLFCVRIWRTIRCIRTFLFSAIHFCKYV